MLKPSAPRFYTVLQVAEALGQCERTVHRAIKAGDLKAHRFGRQVRISEEDFRIYVAMRRGQ